ncbi:hypothetical protein ACWDQL_17800 [Streptomyces olivaceus]
MDLPDSFCEAGAWRRVEANDGMSTENFLDLACNFEAGRDSTVLIADLCSNALGCGLDRPVESTSASGERLSGLRAELWLRQPAAGGYSTGERWC